VARNLAVSAAIAGLVPLAAAAISGCGGAAQANTTTALQMTPASAADVRALNQALAVVQRAIAGYVASGPLLSGEEQSADGLFLWQELRKAGTLRSLITRLGGTAHEPSPRYELGAPRKAHEVIGLLESLEREQLAADARAITSVHAGWIRARIAAILANDAQHLTVLLAMNGLPPPSGAFPAPYAASIDAADAQRVADLLEGERLTSAVLSLALRSGRLTPRAAALTRYILVQEQAHVRALERVLSPSQLPPRTARTTVGKALGAAPHDLQRSAPAGERGWIDLLQAIEYRLEGLLYYVTIPRLSARDSSLGAALLSSEAEHSTLLAGFRLNAGAAMAPPGQMVPAAMVRGWRLRDQPTGRLAG
jgi:hypothetical protein